MLRYIILALLLLPVILLCMVGDSRKRKATEAEKTADTSERPAA